MNANETKPQFADSHMKWTQKRQTVKYKKQPVEVLIRSSNCGRYHIATMPDKGFQFRESIPDGTFPVMIRSFDQLTEAKAFAGTQEENRQKVWSYFVEQASRAKQQADAFVANPKETAGIVEQRMRNDATKTVEQITEDKYSYSKYRSHLRADPASNAWSKTIDPAAARDWEAMLEGTFQQMWER